MTSLARRSRERGTSMATALAMSWSAHGTTGVVGDAPAARTVFHGPLTGVVPAGTADFIITGAASDQVGLSVSGGDLNNDGAGEVIVGAPQFNDADPGYVAVYFGAGGGAQSLSIDVIPRNPPITLPPQGGSFSYDVVVVNESDVAQTIDMWTVLTGPGVNVTQGPFTSTIQPGASFIRTLRQRIAGNKPAGTYTVTGKAGTFPNAEVSDSFTLQKLAAASKESKGS